MSVLLWQNIFGHFFGQAEVIQTLLQQLDHAINHMDGSRCSLRGFKVFRITMKLHHVIMVEGELSVSLHL